MFYTIGIFDDVQGNLKIDFSKAGNEFVIGIYDKSNQTNVTKRFKTLNEAYEVYEKLVSWCIYGYYSDENRKQFLTTGSMN